MTIPAAWYEFESTWTGDGFATGLAVAVGADGRISAVAPSSAPEAARRDRRPREALLPGFVDAHSHAFQRGLRGRGEDFPAGRGSFWTWREAMYDLVDSIDRERLLVLSTQAFREMRRSGITTVGEFHYLHHLDPAAADFAFDETILAAARAAGIRIVLLECYYRAGGPGRPLQGGQKRFDGVSIDRFLRQLERLDAALDPSRETLGIAPHSYRAVSRDEVMILHSEAMRQGLPFQLHVEEQPAEIEEIVAAHHARPIDLLLGDLEFGAELSAVHLTHTPSDRLAELFRRGATACLCPTTEGNLGDGIPALAESASTARLALGSDSNSRISMFEEARWLEYGQRLRTVRRGLLSARPAHAALVAATEGGARALGLPAGRIAPGAWADFAVVDLSHPSLSGVGTEGLADALVTGCTEEVVLATAIGGRFASHREAFRG